MSRDILAVDNEEKDKSRADADKRVKDKEDEDFLEVLNTPAGRRFVFRIIDHGGALTEPFVIGAPDLTNYNLGRVAEGRYWMNELLRVSPDKYFSMCRERKSTLVQKEIIRKNEEE